jgi:hypothetical protein
MPFPWEKEKKEEKKEDDEKLPESLEKRFKTLEEGVGKLSNIEEKLKGLDSITAFVSKQEKEDEDRKKALEDKKKADAKPSGEDLAARLLSGDVENVVKELTEPQANLVLQVRADNVRREVFEDRATDFPYYAGDIKTEVDKQVRSQNLAFQNNPQALENTYHMVVGKRQKEIQEGKLKSRFAASSGSNNSGAATEDTTSREKVPIDITDDIKRAAKMTGLKVEDYVELLRKEEGIEIV